MWRSFVWEKETESFVNAICKIQDVPDFFSFLSPLFKFFKFLLPNSREREGVIDLGILFFIPRNLRFAIFQVEEYSVLSKI